MNRVMTKRQQPVNARFTLPGSKSISNRALLLASLADGVSELRGLSTGHDTKIFIQALQQLGVTIKLIEQCAIIVGKKSSFVSPATIECHSAGTAARFLLAVAAAVGGDFHFDGTAQLRARPITSLIEALKSQGCDFSFTQHNNSFPLQLHSQGLPGGQIAIDGAQSGQFISAMLLAAPLAKTTTIITQHHAVSLPYIEMTIRMMRMFGIHIERPTHDRFIIEPQLYQAQHFSVEPDVSSASYFFAAAAITAGTFTLENFVFNDCLQGDKQFLNVLEQMGCDVQRNKYNTSVTGRAQLQGVEINMQDFSDTFMTLAAIAPFATSPTRITGIAHTRLQESNRISVMCSQLKKLNVRVEEFPDGLLIYPSDVTAGVIDSHDDHRIAMAFALIGLRVDGLEIQRAECVEKTCPEFFDLWENLSLAMT